MQMNVLNCCIALLLMYERKEEIHLKMCMQMKYSRLLMKYSVSSEFLWVTLPVELLLGTEAGCFNEPLGSLSQPSKLCLFVYWPLFFVCRRLFIAQ